jgi:hypothetical protein
MILDVAPYLSIVLTGRNDNFGGDFNERLFRALQFNHRVLMDAAVEYDIVFVEWRPVADRPLLAQLLRSSVPEIAGRLTTYVVDARYHDALSQNPALQFQEFIAKNVGIRRAGGSYILTTNTDIYLSAEVASLIGSRQLQPKVLYRAVRVDLAARLDPTRVDWSVLRDPRNTTRVNVMRPPFFTNGAGDFLLLDRFSYHQLRGFSEVYRVAKIEIDNNFCYEAHRAGVLLLDTGAVVYHLGEGTFNMWQPSYRDRPEKAPWGRTGWHCGTAFRNRPDWGLAAAPVRRIAPADYRLEFAWPAVPPLVELGRVGAAPPARHVANHEATR